MARLRANAVAGQISTSGGITSASTAFDSAALADMPVVASPDIIAVTFFTTDSTGRITASEIAYVTAHTAAATTATITRAQEGTTAAAWALGTNWVAGPTAFDFQPTTITSVTANYAMLATDTIVLASGTITVTLPALANVLPSRRYTIKNIGTGTVTVASSANIDGAASATLSVQYSSLDLIPTATTWYGV